MFLSLLLACSGSSFDYSSGDATAGETVYNDTCAVCHGADGHATGDTGGALSGVDLEEPFTNDADADLADAIINGYGEMAPNNLTDQEAADVIAYCHTLF